MSNYNDDVDGPDRHNRMAERHNLVFCEMHDEIVRLRETLRLILPMAKGYAFLNQVGANSEYIAEAERVLGE